MTHTAICHQMNILMFTKAFRRSIPTVLLMIYMGGQLSKATTGIAKKKERVCSRRQRDRYTRYRPLPPIKSTR
jgi:hypothetical protein